MVARKQLTLRRLLRPAGAILVSASFAGAVQAGELRPWSGFFVGAHGGYHWDAGSASLSFQPDLGTWLSLSPDYGQFHGRYDSALDGFLGGAQLGFNWRSGTLVLGIEADLARLNADGSETRTAMVTEGSDTFPVQTHSRQEIDWLGTVRGRIGILPFDDHRLLIYLTGGLAYARVSTDHSFIDVDLNAGFVGSSSGWEAGGTIGGGLEWAMGGAWTLKAEYLYYDLGDRKVGSAHFNNGAPPEFGFGARYELQGHIARIGLNLQLGRP